MPSIGLVTFEICLYIFERFMKDLDLCRIGDGRSQIMNNDWISSVLTTTSLISYFSDRYRYPDYQKQIFGSI